jgi:membrane protein
MDINRRLDSLGRRWPWFCVVLAVIRRFGEVGGGPLAGSITLATFLSIFPLLLVGIAVVGIISVNSADFVETAIDALGLSGGASEIFTEAINTAADSRKAATIVGLAGLLWSGLAVVGSLSHALDSVWQVTGRGMKDKLHGLLWLIAAFLLLLSGFALTAVINLLPGPAWPAAFLVGALSNTLLFWLMFRVVGNAPVGWRRLMPGAIAAGAGYQLLTALSGLIVPRLVANSSALYGSIGVVFALLAWLFFFGRLIVYSAVLNVILFERTSGTVTVEMKVPRYRGVVPLRADRAGNIEEAVTASG